MKKDLVTRLDALGMSRKDLAQSLGVSLSSIYHWRDIPKYADAYLRQREWLAWRDEVAEAARTRTDVPLADRMTPHVTAFGNVTWSVADESGSDGLAVSSVPGDLGTDCAAVQLRVGEGPVSGDSPNPGEAVQPVGTDRPDHGAAANANRNSGGVKPEPVRGGNGTGWPAVVDSGRRRG